MAHILLIDDDKDFSNFLREELLAHGYSIEYAESAKSGLDRASDDTLDVILLDYRMPGMSGLEVLEVLKEGRIETPVIMMTRQGTSETTIQATILGAFDYIEKGLEIEKFVGRLEPIILKALALKLGSEPRVPISADAEVEVGARPQLLGKCEAMLEVYRSIGQVAPTDKPVLIQGETGTGKELVARAIHNYSRRRDKPFVALNVAALTESLLESELFGHEKGAFTGADTIRKGYFEYANGGTLFLDEIGEMPYGLQANLLRVVENQEVTRIGGEKNPIKVDVRLISATHRDLKIAVRDETFREDLYYRLDVFPIRLPPLRERGSDLRLLGRQFLVSEATKALKPVPTLHPSVIEAVRAHSWPGNVRELKDRLSRAVLRCRGAMIMPADLGLPDEGAARQTSTGRRDGVEALREAVAWAWDSGDNELWPILRDMLERELLEHALAELDGNQTQVAERLGMVRNTVRKRMQAYGLD
jgi:DNA-binding NtrC family response regulator